MARPVTRLSPSTQRLFELADDGEWHDVEPVLAEMGRLVLPGRAYRRAEQNRLNSTGVDEHGNKKPRRKPRTHEELIAIGRHLIARELLNSQRRVERRVVDGVKQFRLRPAPQEGGARSPGAEETA